MGITTMMIMYTVGKAMPIGEGEATLVGEGEAMPVGEEKAKPASEGEKAGGEDKEGIGSRIGRGGRKGVGYLSHNALSIY